MFEQLKPQPADKILSLMAAYREDPRADKIDLGVGVYKNAEGVTPVMRAIKAAEEIVPTLEEAFNQDKPALIAVPVDYRENMKLTDRLGKVAVAM